MTAERITLNESRDVTLTAYLQDVGGEFGFEKRPAMIVIPGGGYSMCSDREADPIATAYLAAGYQTFVLRYTVKSKGAWPQQLEDYEQAAELIKKNADAWNVDAGRIAVVGFSAGGHLAACAATVAKTKPAAAVLVYPVILKDISDRCQEGMIYPHEHVTPDTCPCFFAAARDDTIVDVRNSLAMQFALAENGVPFESHICAYGGHGYSTGAKLMNRANVCPRAADWLPYSIDWLAETLGTLTPNGFVS